LIPDGTFGPDDGNMSPEEETVLLREIFSSDIGGSDIGGNEQGSASNQAGEEEGESEEDEDDEPVTRTVEKELEFADFVLK
jgi:hypothetical protein